MARTQQDDTPADAPDRLTPGRLSPQPGPAHPPERTRLAPQYGPEETVPGLKCNYGTYSYATPTGGEPPRRTVCHRCIEAPDARHHCDRCNGDYCADHADSAAHDCADIITPA